MADIDYSVYLVTGRDLLPPDIPYLTSLEEAIKGGVTVVQVREKHADTGEFLQIAEETKILCDKYQIPLIINDRVDIALLTHASGVHLGQSDMPVAQARALLPPNTIIGVSCNTPDQVRKAVEDGADYVGVGAVYGTLTKALTSPVVGVRGVGERLRVLDGTNVKAVAIGGIKSENLWRTLHGSVSVTGRALDGVAVVSEIVASKEPGKVASALAKTVKAFKEERSRVTGLHLTGSLNKDRLLQRVAELMRKIRKVNPLVHQITNGVVATQSANITLAVGGSPIMSAEASEMEDLSKICNGLLINIGTMLSSGVESARLAGVCANKSRKPIVFDPVGVGASAFRKGNVHAFLDQFQASVIKGNAGELAALAGTSEVLSKGVDSVGTGFKDPVSFVRNLALKERCVIVLTGSTDYISDGYSVVSLSNGVPVLGKITGSGCILGSCIASYCATAVHGQDTESDSPLVRDVIFAAAVAGVLVLTIGAELAVEKHQVHGPGTLLPGLIDALWELKPEDVLSRAKVAVY